MHRRTFLIRASGLMISVGLRPARAARSADDRVGMGTVIFRNRFEQTKPKGIPELKNPLTLLTVPAYYRERFDIRNLEFWSHHFESLETAYLVELRDRVKAAGADLINVQVDAAYDLASTMKRSDSAVLQRCASGSTPRPCWAAARCESTPDGPAAPSRSASPR